MLVRDRPERATERDARDTHRGHRSIRKRGAVGDAAQASFERADWFAASERRDAAQDRAGREEGSIGNIGV